MTETTGLTLHLDAFNIKTVAYKHIREQPILVDVCVPSNVRPGSRPVSTRFHGGYLVYGSRNEPQLIPPRIVDHALENDMVLVSCDHRLLPESTGIEVLEDIEDFWSWIQLNLNGTVNTMTGGRNSVDLQRILVSGESAGNSDSDAFFLARALELQRLTFTGGYLALQLALSHPTEIRAIIAAYPMIDIRDRHFSEAYPKQMGSYPQFDSRIVKEHLATRPDGATPTTREISPLPIAIVQQGLYLRMLGTNPVLFPLERLASEPESASKLPFLWLVHGTSDSEVPIEGSRKFVTKLLQQNPKARIRYQELEGIEHGFSSEVYLIQSGAWEMGAKEMHHVLFEQWARYYVYQGAGPAARCHTFTFQQIPRQIVSSPSKDIMATYLCS